MLHRLDLESIGRQGQVELGADSQRGADFVEQDVGTARAAGDAERHAILCRHFLAQRLFDHRARRSLRFRGPREPHLFRWPVGSVDHMPGEEYDPRQSLLRSRHRCRGGERLVDDAERRRHVVREQAERLEHFDVPARGGNGERVVPDARKRSPVLILDTRRLVDGQEQDVGARDRRPRVAFVLLDLEDRIDSQCQAKDAAIRFAQASRSLSAPAALSGSSKAASHASGALCARPP